MKYLKRFLESNRFESEDDITDYLLELIDDGFLIFEELKFKKIWTSDGNTVIGSEIHYIYSMPKNLKILNEITELEKYIDTISKLYRILKRWNLQFSIDKSDEEELTIIDKSPEYITEFLMENKSIVSTPVMYISSSFSRKLSDKVSIGMRINEKSEFFIDIEGNKYDVEEYISNKIVTSDKYQLKSMNKSNFPHSKFIYEYQIMPK